MRNITTYLIAALMVAGTLAVFPAVDAQGAADVTVSDPSGDVNFAAGFTSGPAPVVSGVPGQDSGVNAAGSDPHSAPIDITELKVYGETATDLAFSLSLADFERPSTYQPNGIKHSVCFSWSGTGGFYRFVFQFSFPVVPSGPTMVPEFQFARFERLADTCDPFDNSVRQVLQAFTHEQFPVTVDFDNDKIDWVVARKQFEQLNTDPDPEVLDPRPAKGDTLDNLIAYGVASSGPSAMYVDSTEAATYTFSTDTGNEHLQVKVPQNIQSSFGLKGFGTPMYGVEKGSFQTVPIIVENHMGHTMVPKIAVTTLEGEAGNWEFRTLPEVNLPAKVGDVPGSETITLIVNPSSAVVHKEKVRLLVTATDETMADMLGAAVVDIVAVEPPTETRNTIYFHSTGSACSTQERWTNTLQNDVSAAATELPFQNCSPGGGDVGAAATSGEVGMSFHPDVPFARNYVMSTTETAKATVALKSVARVGNSDQEVAVPTTVDVKVEIYSGGEVIGSAVQENAEIADAKSLNIEVPILGRILGGDGREVLDERPLNVRFSVITQDRVFEVCREDPCGFQEDVPVPSPGGKVYLLLDQTSVQLPIETSERAGEKINITASGALMTMRLSQGEERTVTNPGKTVVYNVTVRNEGVNKDTAKISATVNKQGWTVEILPTTEYKLDIGQPRQFNVRVTASPTASEGDTARIDLKATSAVDADAIAELPLFVSATTGEQFEDQLIDEKLQKVDKAEESPVGSFAIVLLGIIGLLGVLRRRR